MFLRLESFVNSSCVTCPSKKTSMGPYVLISSTDMTALDNKHELNIVVTLRGWGSYKPLCYTSKSLKLWDIITCVNDKCTRETG